MNTWILVYTLLMDTWIHGYMVYMDTRLRDKDKGYSEKKLFSRNANFL